MAGKGRGRSGGTRAKPDGGAGEWLERNALGLLGFIVATILGSGTLWATAGETWEARVTLAAVALVMVFFGVTVRYWFKLGSPPERSEGLRAALEAGGPPLAFYRAMVGGALDRLDRWIGDAGTGAGGAASAWSGRAFDRLLLLAVAYPLLSLLLVWGATGDGGPLAGAFGLATDAPRWLRWAFLAALGASLFSGARLGATEDWRQWIWLVAWAASLMVAVFIAFAGAGAGAAAVAGAARFAGAFAGAFAVAVAAGFAGAVAVAGAGAGAGAFAFAFAFAVAGAGALAIIARRLARRNLLGRFYLIYWPALLGVVAMLLLLAGRAEEAEEARNAVLAISFLGLLPLINALFDWVSLGLTRYFLRRGSDPARRYPAVYGLADLGLALLTLIGLALMTLAGLHFAEQMFRLGGGAPGAIDLQRDLLGPIRDTPGDPNMWWIYAILFSTLLPTAFHFVLALFSLFAAPVTPLAASLARRVSEQGADGFSRFQVAAMLGFSLTLGIALTVAAFALTFIGLPRLGHAGMGLLGLLERFAAWLPTFA